MFDHDDDDDDDAGSVTGLGGGQMPPLAAWKNNAAMNFDEWKLMADGGARSAGVQRYKNRRTRASADWINKVWKADNWLSAARLFHVIFVNANLRPQSQSTGT